MSKPNHEPSPAEIAEACREIRKGWSARTHYIRAGLRVPSYLAIKGHDDDANIAEVDVGQLRYLTPGVNPAPGPDTSWALR